MKVVVTGGAGFIGANLCRRLAASVEVEAVVAFDDLSTGSPSNLVGVPKTELVVGDIRNVDAVSEAVTGASSVVHLAARPSVSRSMVDPLASNDVNVTGTLSVLEAMRQAGIGHVILASSSSVYGDNPVLPKVETLVPSPVSPYAVSKLAAESYALSYARSFGFDVLAFRFFNVFGPLQAADHAYAAVVPAFVSAALEGRPLPVHGGGVQTRDFTFVDSVTAVIDRAVRERIAHLGPVNLAFGSRHSLQELIGCIEQVLGHSVEQEALPFRAGDVRDSQADAGVLASLLPGLQPVPIEEGVRRTVEWFRSAGR